MAQNRAAAGINLRVIEDKEVLFDFEGEGLIDEATGTFVGSWRTGGLEPTGSSWELSRTINSTETQLTGGVVDKSYEAGPVTSTCQVVPGTPVARYVEWPDTIEMDNTLYKKNTSRVASGFIARVHKFQSGIVGIMVSREKANHTVNGARTDTKDGSSRTITSDWVNGNDEIMVEERFYRIGKDESVTQVTKKRFKTIADLESQIAAGTAFSATAAGGGELEAFVAVAEPDGAIDLLEPEPAEPAG